jgi:DNA-binding transcriptional MocR family regulator
MPLAIAELKFDSSSLVPIRQQICEAIRAAIWSHQLPPGTLLPNSRVLADHLGVSRNTVVFAYTRLVKESLCESKTRRGTRVARDIPYFSQTVETPRLDAPPASTAPLRAAFSARHALETRADPSRMRGPPARLIYVSPSVSFPFGAQMPERRRLEVLATARSQNAIVFECDSCAELRYGGGRIKSLYGLDADRRVIHYGGFFQTLGVFVNVGYLVVPKILRDYFHEIGYLATTTPSAPVLDAIAEFVEENEYAAHIRTVRSVYAKRLETVKRACKEMLPNVAVSEPLGGLHVVLQFDADFDEHAVSEMAASENLPVRSLSQYYQQKHWQKGLVLGFGAVSDQSVPSLVGRIAELIEDVKKATRAPAAEVSR